MKWYRTLLVLALLAAVPALAPAGFLFGKKPAKPDPATRVPELLNAVKNDGDENKRVEAIEELRQFDPNAFPDMIPVLTEVLLHDAKPAVRAEAAQTLGKLRPINQQAGWALEQALAKDASMRVRLQARSALMIYHMNGYHGGKPGETPAVQSKEPPLASPAPPAAAPAAPVVKTAPAPTAPPPSPPVTPARVAPTRVETPPPPLAPPLTDGSVPQRMPAGPPKPPLVPTEPPALQPAPASSGDGPPLSPPE
jgi:HEAT repeats